MLSIHPEQEVSVASMEATHGEPHVGSGIQSAVAQAAQALSEAVGSNGEGLSAVLSKLASGEVKLLDSLKTATNTVFGALDSGEPRLTIASLKGPRPAADYSSFGVTGSLLPLASKQKVGLIRAPRVNEFALRNSDYNLLMVDESLRLGAQLRVEMKLGKAPSVKSLWESCRQWRTDCLDYRSDPKEVIGFSKSRMGNPSYFTTFLSPSDVRYGHILPLLEQKTCARDAGASEDEKALTTHVEATPSGILNRRIKIQYTTVIKDKVIPLTELRTTLGPDGKCIPSNWSHDTNAKEGIESTSLKDNPRVNLRHGVIFHTVDPYLSTLFREVQRKLRDYKTLLVVQCDGKPLLEPLRLLRAGDVSQLEPIMKRLGDLHYLLAHAMFDPRGSAAKSELFIRSLAIAAGIELPPFKAGFVPDLEAFLSSRENFIANYSNVFEQ
jgi:hypothetical protein